MHHLPEDHGVKCFRTPVAVWSVVFRCTQFTEPLRISLIRSPFCTTPFFDDSGPLVLRNTI